MPWYSHNSLIRKDSLFLALKKYDAVKEVLLYHLSGIIRLNLDSECQVSIAAAEALEGFVKCPLKFAADMRVGVSLVADRDVFKRVPVVLAVCLEVLSGDAA